MWFFLCFRQGESTILDMDLVTEEKSAKSSASCQAGKPGRKCKQFAVSADFTDSASILPANCFSNMLAKCVFSSRVDISESLQHGFVNSEEEECFFFLYPGF